MVNLNIPFKICRTAKMVKAEKVDLICIQETHLRWNATRYLKEVFHGTNYHAPKQTKSKGVMTGISNAVPWVTRQATLDEQRQFIILPETLDQRKLIIMVVYTLYCTTRKCCKLLFLRLQESSCTCMHVTIC